MRQIGTLGFVETITVAGQVMPALDLIILTAQPPGGGSSYAGMSADGINVYQVPAGKTLRVRAIKASDFAPANGLIGSGTAATAIGGQVAAPAGDINFSYISAITGGSVGDTAEVACNVTIAQNRYPYGQTSGGNVQVQIFGYLE